MASGAFNKGKAELFRGNVDLVNDDIQALLVDETYTFDPDSDFVADISANELSGTGYSRQSLTTKTVTEDDTNDKATYDWDDLDYTGIDAGTIQGVIIFKQVTTDSDSFLLHYHELNSNLVTNGGDVTLKVPTAGAVDLT